MRVNKIDYEYKNKAIDILERAEMLRDDAAYEIVNRAGHQDTSLLKKVMIDMNYCINILNKYREEK